MPSFEHPYRHRAALRRIRVPVLPAVLAFALMGSSAPGAVLLDRIAVIVNQHPVKSSDIDRDVRLTAFLNNERVAGEIPDRKKAADRLIDQQVIRNEIAEGSYSRPPAGDADALLSQIRSERFAGSEARLSQALAQYDLSEEQVRDHLLWQLTVLRFIDERFRAGVLVADEEIRTYYDQHRANFPGSFAASENAIRTSLEGEEVNRQFETWLKEARAQADVQYRDQTLSRAVILWNSENTSYVIL
jgi:peptidyl-prolyl cis-trans isomerase SurA